MGNGSRGLKLELGRKHRKNDSVTFPDFDESGHSMWLSSDCRSPSTLGFGGGGGSQDPLPFGFATEGCSEEEEVLMWLQVSDASSGVCSSESGDSCCFTQSSCTTQDSATTRAGDPDAAADIWVSSLDLDDVEDSVFEQGFDIFGSDFPSPSVRSKQALLLQLSPDPDSDEEALFWPFDQKSYVLRDDFEKNFLCLSPRKITISPPPSAAAGGCKTRDHPNKKSNQKKHTARTAAAPSRLSRSHRASSDERYCDCTISRKDKCLLVGEPLLDLEMDICRSFAAAQGAAIEALVGLNEFDGREGIGVGCSGDDDDELVLD